MTREQLNKNWEVIEAYKNGAEVEFYFNRRWKHILNPEFFKDMQYRIKPPEYVPFDFTDAEFLIGKVVKDIKYNTIALITVCDNNNIHFNSTYYTYKDLLNRFTFLDGSPCGKVKG